MDGAPEFSLFLLQLHSDPEVAAERYEILRLKITRILLWRGVPESEADALADVVLDRISAKMAAETEIEDINAYAAAVSRFVFLEFKRRHREDPYGDEMPEPAVNTKAEFVESEDERMHCLRKCFVTTVPDSSDRTLLLKYYEAASGEKNKDLRRSLAEHMGLSLNALRVRACRLRAKLENCVNRCVQNVMKSNKDVTNCKEAPIE